MKKLLFAAYIFFCTGGTYAQDRKDTVVADLDFNQQGPITLTYNPPKPDTIRATLLVSRGHMTMAHQRPGYMVLSFKSASYIIDDSFKSPSIVYDTTYLDDRMRPIKAPVTVWSVKLKNQ